MIESSEEQVIRLTPPEPERGIAQTSRPATHATGAIRSFQDEGSRPVHIWTDEVEEAAMVQSRSYTR